MPEKKTVEHAHAAKRAGKSPSKQAGAFVKEQIDHIREGKHGAKSAKQAIAIGLLEARSSGVSLKAPKKGAVSAATRKKAAKDTQAGQHKTQRSASTESTAKHSATSTHVLKREGSQAASHKAFSKQTHASASRRSAAERSASARKGWQTRRAAASKAGATRHAR
ncbi:MAG: Histone H1 [uncultured Caballeronia sp.]|nr:MAG: Histone H1 [uncultured Caballeronia sp.]